MVRRWKIIGLSMACTASLTNTAEIFAECPCKQRSNIYSVSQVFPTPTPLAPIPMPQTSPLPPAAGLPPAPAPGAPQPTYTPPPAPKAMLPPPAADIDAAPAPTGPPITPTPIIGNYAPIVPNPATIDRPGTDRFGMSPPPGTLGRTYHQRSRIFDDEKHPRMAAVDVYLPEEIDVSARGMKSIWTGKHWRLEAKEPLLPGVPHIYAIKAERKSEAGEVVSTEVRWIRLIPGRVVDLKF